MDREDQALQSLSVEEPMPSADGLLLEQIRAGDPDAGHRLVQDYYPGVYRYLLYLTGSPDAAEDLTQETFLQAWRRLDTFEGRSTLRTWLHRIAHREFLQSVRSQQRRPAEGVFLSLEAAGEVSAARVTELANSVELRAIISKLPAAERETVVLHYLRGYQYDEIAHILGVPVGRVRHRLSAARYRLQQGLGEGDLLYLNDPGTTMRHWAWLRLEQMYALEARVRRARNDGADFASGAPRLAPPVHAGSSPVSHQRERDIVDCRLTRRVTLALKATALADVCGRLRAEAEVHVEAGPSVADEKVTLFCHQISLRDVMRSLSRLFGYTWWRSGTEPAYRYELVQELRSQLLEDELRLRDGNAALLNSDISFAAGRSAATLHPKNRIANARRGNDPALGMRVCVRPRRPQRQPSGSAALPAPPPFDRVTTADVLEALHEASGLPVIADYFTRLYPPGEVSVNDEPLFDALNRLGDAMHLGWTKDREWLRFRSTSFFDDRRKEVPTRSLSRWAQARREQGYLTLHDLVEIAQLSDAQLEAVDMAEGAREQWGLAEWDLACSATLRPHLRYLAGFTPAQREAAMSPEGLLFIAMSPVQQRQFLAFALGKEGDGIRFFEDLAEARLRVDYVQPGRYEWRTPAPDWFRWIVPGEPGRRALWSPIRERTPETALEAARQVDPHCLHAMFAVAHREDPRLQEEQFRPHEARILTADKEPQILAARFAPRESQLVRTELSLSMIYVSGMFHSSTVRVFLPGGSFDFHTKSAWVRAPAALRSMQDNRTDLVPSRR